MRSLSTHDQRRGAGFTLIELLVVIVIMGILAGLVLAVTAMMRDQGKRAQTESIIAQAMSGLALVRMEHGGLPQPAEHPLAGSRADGLPGGRPLMVRGRDHRDGASVLLARGTPVATTGFAVRGLAAHEVEGDRSRLLLDDDRYSGGSTADPRDCPQPLLYGVERRFLGVLGAPTPLGSPAIDATTTLAAPTTLPTVTAYRQLSRAAGGGRRTIAADAGHPIAPAVSLEPGVPVQEQLRAVFRRAIEHDLGLGTAQKELGGLGAIIEAEDELASGLIADGRLHRHDQPPAAASWKPGLVRAEGAWRGYRLRGIALYDAWGRELLYAIDRDNPVVMSAGRDGVFRLDPGPDARYQSDPAGEPSGDDRDGSGDNILTVEVGP